MKCHRGRGMAHRESHRTHGLGEGLPLVDAQRPGRGHEPDPDKGGDNGSDPQTGVPDGADSQPACQNQEDHTGRPASAGVGEPIGADDVGVQFLLDGLGLGQIAIDVNALPGNPRVERSLLVHIALMRGVRPRS